MDNAAGHATRRLSYRLSRDDLVACEFQTAKLDFPLKAGLTLMIGAVGLIIASLPPTMDLTLWWITTIGLLLLALMAGIMIPTWRVRRRAERVVAPEGETILEVHETHLVETSGDIRREIPLTSISDVLFGPQHVFLQRKRETIIVPIGAFADLDEMNVWGLQMVDAVAKAKTSVTART
ncbi:MAG TPA: hypothetical protein VGN98_15580 [Tianweitania sediminis]|jgi:hypothetical protein|nr:hypothetical protein [Tianweitania sediminis]